MPKKSVVISTMKEKLGPLWFDDPLDNLIAVCRQGKDGEENRTTTYERDPLGRVKSVHDALGQVERYRYDGLNRVVWKQDKDNHETVTSYTQTGQVGSILYADGTSVELEYDSLRRLRSIKDSLGVTDIVRDRAGRPVKITDQHGQTVSYEWEPTGERRSISYPDGQKTIYGYDSLRRLTTTQMWRQGAAEPEDITYRYDEEGRLAGKDMPDGIRTIWQYNEEGLPKSLTHEDTEGILDRYTYAYDLMGNKTEITRQRRGLEQESGAYTYAYDALGRLQAVEKDGVPLRDYSYDPFGNRTFLTDHHKGSETAYTYDELDRLVMEQIWKKTPTPTDAAAAATKTYQYDNRGNLVKELLDDSPVHTYGYNAMNRLEKARQYGTDGSVRSETAYAYNGLGQRVSRVADGVREDYLLDLTRPYHNLLTVKKNDDAPAQTFYWDHNVAAMEEAGSFHYYLQDEMGSPIRVSGYENGYGSGAYLSYGYDEFGNDLADSMGRELEEAGIPNPYCAQGEEQPFGYTGYRYDKTGGTYFAQAREYQPGAGRFCAQDVILGNGAEPVTLNRYGYCLGNPVGLVDADGREPEDYEAVYYLNAKEGAAGFGHAALLFVREDGSGTYYSFAAADAEINIENAPTLLSIVSGHSVQGRLASGEMSADEVQIFFIGEKGENDEIKGVGRPAKGIDDSSSTYTRGVYIPITPEEGRSMTAYAEELVNNPPTYNLFEQNCSMIAQEILSAGEKDFHAKMGSRKAVDEQIALGMVGRQFLGSFFNIGNMGMAGGIIISKGAIDYFDGTIPNGVYLSSKWKGMKSGTLEELGKERYGELEECEQNE